MAETKRQYVEVSPGVDLYVEETGEGRPLVFIPGWTMTTEMFARQVPHFADRYRVVTYDPRCQGRSTKTTDGISHSQTGRDLGHLLEVLHVDRPVLLPWSDGCLDVWELFRQCGYGDVAGLVLIDQSPQQVMQAPGDWCTFDMGFTIEALRALADSHAAFARGLSIFFWQTPPPEDELDWFVRQSTKTPEYVARLLWADTVARDATDMAEAIDGRIPVLHVVSEPRGAAARTWLAGHCPAAQVEALGLHFMFWEHADRFNSIVDRFLATHGL